MEENSILVQGLCKRFKDFALEDLSFTVPKGRIVGFIGENGAGKSTTIRLILNELKKDAGRVELFGADHADPALRRDIGVVFDECAFPEVLTAKDAGRILAGVYPGWDGDFYRRGLERFQIPPHKPMRKLSKGMKMKLSILCAMAHRPKLLILDEATTGLDPVVRDEILDMFLDFIQDEERALFFSSHIISDIEKVADYVILTHRGRIAFEEQKDRLVEQYGVAKCRRDEFAALAPEDYLMARRTGACTACLVADKEKFRSKHKNILVDNSTLEDILLFYAKGETSCAG